MNSKVLIAAFLLALAGLTLAQPAAIELREEPEYTQGRSNTIQFEIPEIEAPDSIIALDIHYDTSIDFPSPRRIWPITDDSVDVSTYTDYTVAPSGMGLLSGTEYFYRIRYRYSDASADTFMMSPWSNIVSSIQDSDPPSVTVDDLPVWVNEESVEITFEMSDAICGWADSAKLYYRHFEDSTWNYVTSEVISGGDAEESIDFISTDFDGDDYYEFFVAGIDSLGNEKIPYTYTTKHAWTRFDNELPISEISTEGHELYYTDETVILNYTAEDMISGLKRVELWIEGAADRYDYTYFEGATSVSDSFIFTGSTDGHYQLYTQAYDSAGNIEEIVDADIEFYIDTHIPIFTGVNPYDQTVSPSRYDVPAEEGWTNNTTIWVDPVDAEDPEFGDDYASGIDTVYIAEDDEFSVNVAALPWSEGMEEGFEYNMLPGLGVKEVFVKLVDVAGNTSDTLSNTVLLDTIAPQLESVDLSPYGMPIRDVTHDEYLAVHFDPEGTSGSYSQIYFTQTASDLDYIEESEWRAITDTTFDADGTPGEWIRVYVVLRDSAGNVSEEMMDSILFNPGDDFVEINHIKDIDGPDFRSEYTDSNAVDVILTYGSNADSVFFWDDALTDTVAYEISSDETGASITDTLRAYFTSGDGVRWVYAMTVRSGLRPYSDRDSMSIILDTRDPILRSISLEDESSGFDLADTSEVADHGFTNDPRIKVLFNDASDDRTGLYHVKMISGTASHETAYSHDAPSMVYFDLPAGDGEKAVEAAVQDSAGNWSDDNAYPAETLITLDTHDPILHNMTLADYSDGDTFTTDTTLVTVILEASDDTRAPAYIAFFENFSDFPTALGDRWREYSETMVYEFENTTPGTKTLYAALKDKAGNISRYNSDDINLDTGIELEIELYDITSNSNMYTDDFATGIRFITEGSPPAYYYVSETGTAPSEDEWIAYPDDDDTLHTFTPGEGPRQLCAWVQSVSGIVSEMVCATITIDRTAPELTGGFYIYDTTSVDDYENLKFTAHMGWSNERYVYGSIPNAQDFPPGESGVDSSGYFGPFIDSLWIDRGDPRPNFRYNTSNNGVIVNYNSADSIPLVLHDVQASVEIIGRAKDIAGNWGNIHDPNSQISFNGGYDSTPPTLDIRDPHNPGVSVDLLNISVNQPIPMHIVDGPGSGHIWKVCAWFDELPGELVCTEIIEDMDDAPNYNIPLNLEGLLNPRDESYEMHIVSIDSAGNPSSPVDIDLFIYADTLPFKFVLTDPVDTSDTGYTNQQVIHAVVDPTADGGEWKQVRFSQDPEFPGAEWVDYERRIEFELNNLNNEEKTVYCQTSYGGGIVASDTFASIIVDTRNPSIGSVEAYDIETGDPNLSTSYEVRIVIEDATDPAPGVLNALACSEEPDFTEDVDTIVFDPALTHEVIYRVNDEQTINEDYIEPGREDERIIFCKVLDRAENASETAQTGIVVDADMLEVSNHPNPFNPIESSTYIRVKANNLGATADISIYDMFGHLVNEMSETAQPSSRTMEIEWNGYNNEGSEVASGVYVCIVEIGDEVFKRKIAVWRGE
ncbi:MAG: hypothetical protein ACLFSQ_04055 [Candidatus Zixiibacteriota bacterium]